MTNYSLGQRGFGMLQAMVLAGVMAAGALVATRLINDLKLTQRGAATRDDLEALHGSVVAALQDSAHCTATMGGAAITPLRIALGDATDAAPTNNWADNPVLIQEGATYMGNSVKVSSIVMNFGGATPNIAISYSRLKSDAANRLGKGYGGQDIRKVINLHVINDAVQGNRCYLDAAGFNTLSTQEFCQSLGQFMVWDPVAKKCSLDQHACPVNQAFIGIDLNGNEICRDLNSTLPADNLFETTSIPNCSGRTALKLVVDPGTLKIKMECIGCTPAQDCTTLQATYCPADPVQTTTCLEVCGTGTKSSGCAATLTWSPLVYDFGSVVVGGNSTNQTFTLTNSSAFSTAGCSAPTISDTTNFTLTPSGNCIGTANIAAGGNCTVVVRGNPTSIGQKTATLSRTCTTGGVASTTTNEIKVNGGSGACQGQGDDNSLMTAGTVQQPTCPGGCGTCTAPYPYAYREYIIDTAKFQTGNIYYLGIASKNFTAEALSSDTPLAMLNRLASSINSANAVSTGACSTSSAANATTISPNIIRIRQQFQHSPAPGSSRSCNITTQATCTATPNCAWDTTSPNVCKGFNYTVPQGTCSGTYSQVGCAWDQFNPGGSDPACNYGYSDSTSCNAANFTQGCSWGFITQTCSASDSASCSALGGGTCSWTAYSSRHQTCTSTYIGQATCQANSPPCTWGPP